MLERPLRPRATSLTLASKPPCANAKQHGALWLERPVPPDPPFFTRMSGLRPRPRRGT